ncbi:MAG: hypothetical protein HY047_19330 [Acidobacteria bacterium]|nr:hypothetical protein [Acidobacteriota bacterium]
MPSLHVQYKKSKVKQYHKEGQALRLHGLIERVPDSHRYRITDRGATTAMFYVRLYARALRPVASLQPSGSARGHQAFDRLDAALANFLDEVKLVA